MIKMLGFINTQEISKIIEIADKLLQKNPNNTTVLYWKGVALFRLVY